MKINRSALSRIFSYLLLIVFIAYFVFWSLRTARSPLDWSLGLMTFWTIILPIVSVLPYSLTYILCLPSPIFGATILIMALMEKYSIFSGYSILIAFILSLLLISLFHMLTRKRTMLSRIPMASLSRIGLGSISLLLFVFCLMLINPSAFKLDVPNEMFYFFAILLSYIASSMLYLNYGYRLFALGNRLGILNPEKEFSETFKEIERKYPERRKDLDLLEYYFSESFRCFLEGDIEKGYDWGYKVIREKTIVDPLEYVDDKRAGKPSFGDIRNTLMHSRRKGHTDKSEISQIRKNLFNDLLDLLERCYLLIGIIAEGRTNGDDGEDL
jgi:hypothetical protein